LGIVDKVRVNRLIDKFYAAGETERPRLRSQLLDVLSAMRESDGTNKRYRAYCEASLRLGQLFAESGDPSDALRPVACAYVVACAHGDGLMDLRREALDTLSLVYTSFGEFGLAAECAFESLGSHATMQKLAEMLFLMTNADPRSDIGTVTRMYQSIRSDVVRSSPTGRAMGAVIDVRLGLARYDYAGLAAEASPLTSSDQGDLTSAAHRALAEAALAEGLLAEAEHHAERALSTLGTDRAPWLAAALTGLSARVLHSSGKPQEAFDRAMQGWSSVIPAMLTSKDDFARDRLRWLASSCVETGLDIACERRDWDLLTDLLENSRLQLGRTSPRSQAEQVAAARPAWIAEDFIAAHARGIRAGLHAMLVDWKSGTRNYFVTSWRGSSAVPAALQENPHGLDGENRSALKTADAHEALGQAFERGAVAWFAAVAGDWLYWTISDQHGAFDGGKIDLGEPGIAASLRAFRDFFKTDANGSPDTAIDVVAALSEAGSLAELELLAPLSKLVPDFVVTTALSRPDDDPLRVLLALPPELSMIPWGIVPLDISPARDLRLVERVELTVLTPTAVRNDAPEPRPRETDQPVVLSCSNPAGDLKNWAPVPGHVTLAGTKADPVTIAAFLDAVDAIDRDANAGEVLFVRSHLGSDSRASFVADKGVAFADGVLSARSMATLGDDGRPPVAMTTRAVLSLCSGAGAGDFSGLSLGLAAACRLAGAEEVVTTLFKVLDTRWGCLFDERLAAAATGKDALASALRDLQLQCLAEWRTSSVLALGRDSEEGPHPLVWAAYVLVD
jgi:CHAT domain